MTLPVATGLAHGVRAEPQLAAQAVEQALQRAGLTRAHSLLLLLTPHFAPTPDSAIRAAARAAGTMQVFGCTGAGVLTEDDWLLDTPGAAAMVFGGAIQLTAADNDREPILSLCTPSGLDADWLDREPARFGAVSGDLFGQGPFRVWHHARVAESGRAESYISGARGIVDVSQGMRALTAPIEVAESRGLDVFKLGNYPALNVLMQSLPQNVREQGSIPLHLILGGVTFGDPNTAIREGRYRLNHLISADPASRSVTFANPLAPGERVFWAMRDALTAERDFHQTLEHGVAALGASPEFAFLFPCMGRGPHFYGNRDRDLDHLKSRFPEMPIIGFYGNGEIAPLDGANHLYQYSAVLGLFHATH